MLLGINWFKPVLNNLDNYMHNAYICVHFSQNTKNKDHFVHSGPEPLGISLQYLRGKVFIYFEIKHCTNIGTGRRIFVKTTIAMLDNLPTPPFIPPIPTLPPIVYHQLPII